EQSMASAERFLADEKAIREFARPEGAVAVVFQGEEVNVFPNNRLPFYPVMPVGREAPLQLFAAADEVEFQRRDHREAISELRILARSTEPSIRAAALIRLARNLRKAGETTAALAVYSEAAGIHDATVGGIPADLVAYWARCDLLAQKGREAALREQARLLLS